MSENKTLEQNVADAYFNDLVRYTIAVDIARALPDVRDGLKPVHRRILTAMGIDEECIKFSKKRKSAKIVGTTMGKYHPHGDTSIYDALTIMALWFKTKQILVAPHGQFGTMEGDGAAAMRYTECYLSEFSMDTILNGLNENPNIVDWSPTFDEQEMEPEYLPVRVPLLLINGTFGIGVGIQVNIPSHNLAEVIDATIHLMDNPKSDIVLIPDFCMRCHMVDTDWRHISKTGKGTFYCRARIDIGTHEGNPALFITDLPDMVTGGAVKEKISALIEKGQLTSVENVLLSTDDTTLNMIVVMTKGADPNYVMQVLYKRTQLESSYSVNFEVIQGIEPLRFSYKQYLSFFIEEQMYLLSRDYAIKLQKEATEFHQKDAYIKVLKSGKIDEIIQMIRNSTKADRDYMVEYLIKTLKITDLQAKFILDTRLQNIAKGKLKDYEKDANDAYQKIVRYRAIISDEKLLAKEIKDYLIWVKQKYGKPRCCDVIKADIDAIPEGNFNIVITDNNYIRKIGENDYANVVRGDRPKFVVPVSNRENVIIFDNKGRVFRYPVNNIPSTDKTNPGVDLRQMIKGFTSDVIALVHEPVLKALSTAKMKHYLTVVTEGNTIKKMDLDDFLNIPISGLVYSKLRVGDSVKDIELLPNVLDVIVYTHHKALRFSTKDIGHYKRITQGDYAMKTDEPICGLSVVYPDAEFIVVITANGKINKFNIEGLGRSDRYRAGTNVIKLDKTDSIVTIFGVRNTDTVVCWSADEMKKIPVSEIKIGSSISTGTKFISTQKSPVVKVAIEK